MKRRVCDYLVEVQVHDDRPIRFTWDERDYEVVTLLKMLGLMRPRDDVDTQLWQVRAQSDGLPRETYELRRDHGEWRLTAFWE